MKVNAKRILLLTAILLLLFCTFVFYGCNAQTVYEGTIISKSFGEPLLFSVGQLKMVNPSERATYYSFVVQDDNGNTAKVYVTQDIYEAYQVGDWFDIANMR